MLLTLLFVKHWFVDFVLQNDAMVKSKVIYGSSQSLLHSLQHASFTLALLLLATSPLIAIGLAIFDGLAHYHIDYIKSIYGEKDINKHAFWSHLGADQLAHAITYIIIFNALL